MIYFWCLETPRWQSYTDSYDLQPDFHGPSVWQAQQTCLYRSPIPFECQLEQLPFLPQQTFTIKQAIQIINFSTVTLSVTFVYRRVHYCTFSYHASFLSFVASREGVLSAIQWENLFMLFIPNQLVFAKRLECLTLLQPLCGNDGHTDTLI